MLVKEKEMARDMRRDGKSLREITEILGVSKASASVWVRDITLTVEQKDKLAEKYIHYSAQNKGSTVNREKAIELRRKYQEEGRELAKNKNYIFSSGCMLYWGEGTKNRNSVIVANTDPNLLRFFIKFLLTFFYIKIEDIKISIHFYVDSEHRHDYYENYWINELGLCKESLNKSIVDHRPRTSVHKGKGKKHNNGVCTIRVHRTDIVQKIYGAIQELAGFSNDRWLS